MATMSGAQGVGGARDSRSSGELVERVASVRRFNRFYTRLIGVLDAGLLGTPFSLTEARVLYELAQASTSDASDLSRRLGLDAGYLSRILRRFEGDGLVSRERHPADGRRHVLRLTPAGGARFSDLDARASRQIGELLEGLSPSDRRDLGASMGKIEQLLGDDAPARAVMLREPRSGDYGWIVHRHGVLYADEFRWDERFEALVGRIVAEYIDRRDRRRENAWIAEIDGEAVGCVFCTRRTDEVAQLRLLLVEPRARGMGIGSKLVEECVRFARAVTYAQMMLWTNDVLLGARRIYERFGFELREQARHHSFGHDLVGENWWLALDHPVSSTTQQSLTCARQQGRNGSMKVSFCGLGQLGAPTAARLVDEGHELTVWNRSAEKMQPLIDAGATQATSPAAAASESETVITMLASPAAVEEVVFGEIGIAAGIRRGSTLIEMSTIGPGAVHSLAGRLPDGVEMVDAPVLGSVPEAAKGALKIFVGSSEATYDGLREFFSSLGDPIRLGPLGSGAAMKLVVNSTLGAIQLALGEALVLSDALGLDRHTTLDVLEGSPLGPTVKKKRRGWETGVFEPSFKLALAAKDMRLVTEAGHSAGAELPGAEAARLAFESAAAAGWGDHDYSALAAYLSGRPSRPGSSG